jgi:class 3 adenylate cyclase
MVATSLSRRLVAVLIADVAGYSRLMERDESGTHVRIRALLAEVVEPAIAENHGRLLRIVGDGVLAEFPSATDAVRCAVSIQRQCAARSAGVVASDRIALRIGINVADVLYDESDIAGGGVNLAARLETLSPPGGICISQALREQIHEDLGVTYLDAGIRRVKNISKPVRVMHVLIDPPRPFERGKVIFARLPLKKLGLAFALLALLAIAAILVFENPEKSGPEKLTLQVGEFRPSNTSDTEAARVGKLLSQQIYLALSPERRVLKIKGPQPSESSSPAGRPVARYVVEGVVTTVDGKFRVDARLVETQSRDTSWGDSFNLRDASSSVVELGAHRVANALHSEVVELEIRRIAAAAPRQPDSMDLVLLGYAARNKDEQKQLFERALTVDPDNVPALLAMVDPADRPEWERLSRRAVTADPMCAAAWTSRGQALFELGQTEAAREAVGRALSINPSNPYARYERELLWLNDGMWERVIRPLEDVEFEFSKAGLGHMLQNQCRARFFAGQDATLACNRWFAVEGSERSLIAATAAAAKMGTSEQALKAGARLRESYAQLTVAAYRRLLEDSKEFSPTYLQEVDRTLVPALLKAGIPER